MGEGTSRDLGGVWSKFPTPAQGPVGAHPPAARALQEMGIDISSQRSNHVHEFAGQTFDFI
jgi:hypothetical protein